MAEDKPRGSILTVGDDFDLDGDTIGSSDGSDLATAAQPLPTGARAGRYLILGELGRGGMGVVYKAYDPELDRRIALKVLSISQGKDSQAIRARDRLLREAKALAQLSHPNVVAAFDVGTLGEDVFVAMELVEGKSLREWIEQEQPGIWQKIKVMIAAGHGIAAAHQAGLVHRDIKPDNIIVGDDGRVRVLDFGLARAAVTEKPTPTEDTEEEAPGEALPAMSADLTSGGNFLAMPMTLAGAIVGTPGYMAPEQYLSGAIDEQTDQYSFCVTLYETLYGCRPFQSSRFKKLRKKVLAGQLDPPPSDVTVPARYRRILLRGMAVTSAERYPSMSALLGELAQDPRLHKRRWLAIFAVCTLVATSFAGAYAWQESRYQLCAGADRHLTRVWDRKVSGQVREQFLATARPYAQDTYRRVEKILSGYAEDWVAMRVQACEATHVRGEQSEALLDKRMACLSRRLSEMAALTHLFATKVDDGVIDKAVQASLGLASLSACADAEALLAAIPPPADPAVRARIEALRVRLDEARAQEKAGHYPASLGLVQSVEREARGIDYAPLQAETLFVLGCLQSHTGDAPAAVATIDQAIRAAAAAQDDNLRARATTELIYIVGYEQAQYQEALAIGRLAQADVIRAGNSPVLRAIILNNLGIVYSLQGKQSQASTVMTQALALVEKALGPDHPKVASGLNNLGEILLEQGEFKQASAYFSRSMAILKKAFGPRHPNVGFPLNNLGLAYLRQDQAKLSAARFSESLSIWEDAYGKQHSILILALSGLGKSLLKLKKPARALPILERSLALQMTRSNDALALAPARLALGRALVQAGRERNRAMTLVKKALAGYVAAGDKEKTARQEVEAWLAALGEKKP